MRKTSKNILKILILTIIFQFAILVNTSQAGFWSEVFTQGSDFLEQGKNEATSTTGAANDAKVKQIMNDLYSVVFPLGVVATVIMGGVLGIKFMLASAEDKAKVKESMVPYVVGCVVIYGALGIWRIAIEIFSALS